MFNVKQKQKRMGQLYKQAAITIDAFAQKRLSHLQANTFPFEIIGCIDDFRRDLANHNIIIDEIEDKEITHSAKMLMELNQYFQAKNDCVARSGIMLNVHVQQKPSPSATC